MPVYTLLEEMPYEEMLKWIEFFKRRPIGWREDQRAYLFLRTQGVKEPAENLFPSLRLIAQNKQESQTPNKAVPKGKIMDLMLRAKNGDTSGWKPTFGDKNVNKNKSGSSQL